MQVVGQIGFAIIFYVNFVAAPVLKQIAELIYQIGL